MNAYKQLKYLIERKILLGFSLKKNDLVIDIGSGDRPFWRADVFLDNTNVTDNNRSTRSKAINSFGLFVDGDISKTNFKDKAFDFSYCSHVLEHVLDPEKAIHEIMRISKKGYIEVPNGVLDLIAPEDNYGHLWLVFLENDTLLFVRRGQTLHDILCKNGKMFAYLNNKINEPFIRIYWKDKIKYKIVSQAELLDDYYPKTQKLKKEDDNQDIRHFIIKYYGILVTIMRSTFYEKKTSEFLNNKIFAKKHN